MEKLQRVLVAWHFVIFLRMFVAFILLAAGVAKLQAHREFVAVVRNYRLLPDGLVRWVAYVVPGSEVVVAAGLLTGYGLDWAAAGAVLLFVMFAAAIAVNLLRGRRQISCGCFGGGRETELSWALVLRNSVLAAGAASVWLSTNALAEVEKLSVTETIYVMLVSGAVLAAYWLWGVLQALRQLPRVEDYFSLEKAKGK